MVDTVVDELAKREQGFPLFRRLFDSGFVESIIPENGYVTSIQPYYVRYKPGTSCLVQYSYYSGKDRKFVYLKAYSEKDRPERMLNEDIEIYAFPDDGVLRQIKNVFDERAAPYFFHTIDPMHEEFHTWHKYLLSYRPEKRLVMRLISGDDSIVMKIFNKSSYRYAVDNNRTLVSSNDFQCPALIAENQQYQVITNEWVPGNSLYSTIEGSQTLLTDSMLVAKGLAKLHAQAKVGLKFYHISAILNDIEKIEKELLAILPDASARIERLCGNIKFLVERVEQLNVPCHGDFDANQVIIEKDRVSFIDFDRACIAHPALDVGNYLAKLTLWNLCGFVDDEKKALLHNAFVSGYCDHATVNPRDVDNYYLLGLLKCCTEPFRRQYANWPTLVEDVLRKIELQIHVNSGRQNGVEKPRKRARTKDTVKVDNLSADESLRYLSDLLDVDIASEELTQISEEHNRIEVNSVRIIKHREGKRCLMEFNCNAIFEDGFIENTCIMGKARAKGLDKKIFQLQKELWEKGFSDDSEDNISIPKPCGVLQEYNMWLYKKIDGESLASRLNSEKIRSNIAKIAETSFKLQNTAVTAWKHHTVKDELKILKKGMHSLKKINHRLQEPLDQLYQMCEKLAVTLPNKKLPIHRDYYPHQVVVSSQRFFLIDMDLFCYGDPCLDIGNFIAHIKEQALREKGEIDAYIELEKLIENRYCQLNVEEDTLIRINAYTWLAMARHVYLSSKYPERHANVEYILDLCLSRMKRLNSK